MKYYIAFSLVMLITIGQYGCSDIQRKSFDFKTPRIIIGCTLPSDYYKQHAPNPLQKDVREIFWMSINDVDIKPKWNVEIGETSKESIWWTVNSEKPVFVTAAFQRTVMLFSPGDSVQINYSVNGISYSGKGAESLRLQNELEAEQNKLVKPTAFYININSLGDYLKWNDYLNKRLSIALTILQNAKENISQSVKEILKMGIVYKAEMERAEAFMALNSYRLKNNERELTAVNLAAICDSTLNGTWAKWLRACGDCSIDTWYFYQYNRIQVWKEKGFDLSNDSINTEGKRNIIFYRTLKERYTGLLRERLLQYLVANEAIKKSTFKDPITQAILSDYYNQPGFPEYKQWMKKYADSMREKQIVAQNTN